MGAPSEAKAYGSYEEFVKNPDIDIVYIATPHSHHYQNAMLCLEGGKNVLCEKAFTVNAAQARKLAEVARSKNLFLMEAVWTRYFPLSIYVREQITSGRIGPITRVISDNSMALDPENNFPDGKNRMVNPDLAGGVLPRRPHARRHQRRQRPPDLGAPLGRVRPGAALPHRRPPCR